MVRALIQVKSLGSSPKAGKDQCSATEQISHSFSLSFFRCGPWRIKWCFPSQNVLNPKQISSISTLQDILRSNVFQLSIYLSVHSHWHITSSHLSICKKLSSHEWPYWSSTSLVEWGEPVPEQCTGASLQWGLVSWSHLLIKCKSRYRSGNTNLYGLQRAEWHFPMTNLFWSLLLTLDCLFQNW